MCVLSLYLPVTSIVECTVGYTLYMRYASTSIKISRFGMVFYNNFLSLFLMLPLVLMSNEGAAFADKDIMTIRFLAINTLAGFLGFYLNFASLWCVSATSATTYSIVGSLNKIPILILCFILFNAKMTSQGILFIVMSTVGGFIYAFAKMPKQTK